MQISNFHDFDFVEWPRDESTPVTCEIGKGSKIHHRVCGSDVGHPFAAIQSILISDAQIDYSSAV